MALGCRKVRRLRLLARRSAGSRAGVARAPAQAQGVEEDVESPENLYDLLGVEPGADPGTIKRAYYDKQKICHPDVAGPEGEEMCMILNDAYDVLGDEDKRQAYDVTVTQQARLSVPSLIEMQVDTDLGPAWQSTTGHQADPDPEEDDLERKVYDGRGAVWQGDQRPVWTGRPLSHSNWKDLEPAARGQKWEDRRFVYVDPFTCINCHNCCDSAPSTFYIDYYYGKARVFTQWGDAEEDIDWAVKSCPVDCIYWVSREELQYLEFATADTMYETGGEMANSMLGGRMTDPFAKAARYKARVASEKQKQESRGVLKLNELAQKMRAAFARLPTALRIQGWARRSLKP